MKSVNKVLYWDRSVITDTAVDCSRPDTAPIDRQNKIALVIDIRVPLAHNVPKTEAEKILIYENLDLEIKNIWKLTTYLYAP
jgi:hypothetical protein